MGVARWRWLLSPFLVVLAGCLPQPGPALPADFFEPFGGQAVTFTALPAPVDATGDDLAARVSADHAEEAMFQGRSVLVFGRLDCHSDPACRPGPSGTPGGARTVWVILYPDCAASDWSDGWAVVDAVDGVSEGVLSVRCGP